MVALARESRRMVEEGEGPENVVALVARGGFTQAPNAYFDGLFGRVSPTAYTCLMYVVRQTLGYHRESVRLSYKQLGDALGVSRNTALRGMQELEAARIVGSDGATRGRTQVRSYALLPVEGWTLPTSTSAENTLVHPTSPKSALVVSKIGLVSSPTSPKIGHALNKERNKALKEKEIAPSAVAEARPHVRSPHVTPSTAATPAAPPTMAAQPPKVNPLWDVLMEIFNPTGETLTRVAKSNYGRVVRDLKEAGATPEEVRLRVDRYCARYGAQYLTINAIDKWWPEMGQEQQQKGTGANDAAAERRARERRDAEREAADEERAREAQITKALVAQYRRRHEAE